MCIPGGGRTHGLPLTSGLIQFVEGGRVIHCATGINIPVAKATGGV